MSHRSQAHVKHMTGAWLVSCGTWLILSLYGTWLILYQVKHQLSAWMSHVSYEWVMSSAWHQVKHYCNNTLQHTATLQQHTATHCNTATTHCNTWHQVKHKSSTWHDSCPIEWVMSARVLESCRWVMSHRLMWTRLPSDSLYACTSDMSHVF